MMENTNEGHFLEKLWKILVLLQMMKNANDGKY